MLMSPIANIGLEAAVVGIICSIFLVIFVIAGIREITKGKSQDQ